MILDSSTLERYRLKLRYKVSYHLGSSCPDVDDIVQETMLRFVRSMQAETIRNPESIAAFLSGREGWRARLAQYQAARRRLLVSATAG